MRFSKVIYMFLFVSILVLTPINVLGSTETAINNLSSGGIKIVDYIALAGTGFIVFILKILHSQGFKLKENDILPLINKLSYKNPDWSLDNIKKVVETTFFSIQESWTSNTYYNVKDLMTPDLYNKHIAKLNEMTSNYKTNILKDIKINELYLVSASESNYNNPGFIWINVQASMIDYILDIRTNEVSSGNKNPNSFEEYWKFIYINNKWLLCEILQKDSVINISQLS
ncbi:Tim44 domain-containing protein [Paraclostridium sordellii]|uniref:Tim44 domain-containing protein n=1 Tax=Paraclostridium sordellii TaxID=1505 RepID=UPI0005DDC77C|nr:Tim44-like domain-containing protein [Paeniclostridium sordellii]CEO06533.1 membrane protein [[Clostridium] sordellii] [Paeniclostridium sordellii]CEP86568.1 membrane protein [[Clostridium] sordellii] [Paeniclostridium sordellii]CEP96819.1 membrane protein [[Clostridium] sordellii] [Paeniclostridium sordellii]CEP99715.1 membrane protein [[Clostridium] sordellii] [Paeniclostridium sordellii]